MDAKSQMLRRLRVEGVDLNDEKACLAALNKCVLPKPLKEAYMLTLQPKQSANKQTVTGSQEKQLNLI